MKLQDVYFICKKRWRLTWREYLYLYVFYFQNGIFTILEHDISFVQLASLLEYQIISRFTALTFKCKLSQKNFHICFLFFKMCRRVERCHVIIDEWRWVINVRTLIWSFLPFKLSVFLSWLSSNQSEHWISRQSGIRLKGVFSDIDEE